jgi:uncharacterized membrane protein
MRVREFILTTLLSGLLVLAPIYVAVLLLLKAMNSLMGLVRPVARVLPEWLPGAEILSLLLVLFIFFLVGLLIRTRVGQLAADSLERHLLRRLPGYTTIRALTNRLVGENHDNAWKPALAEIEEALVPAFIIEELEDGRLTVFVPSVPTPLAGAVYILSPNRVHPVNIPFTQAIRVISQWGAGCSDLVAAMEKPSKFVRKEVAVTP